MSISINPAAATESLQKFNVDLQEMINSFEPIRASISNYVTTFKLRGEAYSKHKAYMQNGHMSLLAKKIELLQQIIDLNNQHINLIATHLTGLPHFDQFHILGNIRALRLLISMAPSGLSTFVLERQLQLWVDRERQLETFVFLTNNLYDDVESGMASIDVRLARLELATLNPTTGRFHLPSIADIKTKRAELELNKKANELIIAIGEKGIPFPEDWSEQDKLDFARRYLVEMKLLEAHMISTFTTRDFRENFDEALGAQIAFLFLSDIDLAFRLTLEQRMKVKEIVKVSGGWLDSTEEYLLSIGITNDVNKNVWGINTGIGDARWLAFQVSQTYVGAGQGFSYHERMTFLLAISWIEGGARLGSVVQKPIVPNAPKTPPVRGMDSWRGTGGNKPPPPPPPKTLDRMTPREIRQLTPEQLQQRLPKDWSYNKSPDGRFIHIRDANGKYRIKIDPADRVTNYRHIHILDGKGNALDINGNVVPPNSPAAHIPY